MGIDVWVRRRAVVPEDVPTVAARPEVVGGMLRSPRIESPVTTAASARPPSADTRSAASSTSVEWTAVSAGRVVLLARLGVPHDRRLAQDLVLAAAGYPSEGCALVTFVQTHPSGATGSAEVAAFARGQTDRRRAERLILTMTAARELGVDAGATDHRGVRVHVIQEADALR